MTKISTHLSISAILAGTLLTCSAQVPANGLLAYFPMDGSANDFSGTAGGSSSANHGTWIGTAGYQTGLFGQAAVVGNGAGSNYLTTASMEYTFGTGSVTILYWVHVSASVSSDPVLVAGGGKNWSSSGGTLGWVSTIAGDDVKSNISDGSTRMDTAWIDLDHDAHFNDNRSHWTLVAMVVDRTTQTMSSYVLDDNVTTIGDDSSAPSSVGISSIGNITGSNQSIVIGQDGNLSGYSLPASGIDDLSIWSRPLSQEEIQIIYTEGRAGKPLNQVLGGAYLTADLDKDAGTAALTWNTYDSTGLTAPEIRVFRDGSLLSTLPIGATNYTDSPPAPIDTVVSYTYRIEVFDGGSAVPDTSVEAGIAWALGGLSFNLIANYRFEDGFKDTASGPTAHNGVGVNGASITGNGVYGKRVKFLDQLQQGVQVSDHADLNFGSDTDFTISLWMKRHGTIPSGLPNGGASDGVLLCKQDSSNGASPGWGLYATSDGGVQWNIAGSSHKSGTILGGATLADDLWHHILVSNDRSGSVRCYVDGAMAKSFSISGAGSVNNTLPLSMGIDGNGAHSWKGSLDEVAIWSRVLDDSEATDVYKASKKGQSLSGQNIVNSDGDKMADQWEITHFGNLDQTADGDYDNDGKSNFQEYSEGDNPNLGSFATASRVSNEEVNGQIYPVLHYLRSELEVDVSYLPEASSNLKDWTSGDEKFTPYGNPTDKGNGQREYHVRYFQPIDAVAEGRVMFRVRMESRYQAAISETTTPSVELRNGQAIVTWTTSTPTVTVINYGTDGQTSQRYEDYTLTTYHEVVINVNPGEPFTYTVIQTDESGKESRSNTFTVSALWDYSPPPVPDQFGFDSTSGGVNWSARADAILALPGVIDRGYCLDYLCGDAHLAYELARKSQLVVIGVEDTQVEVNAARVFLSNRGVYGSRVTVVLASDLANLPFPKDFFNLIVSQSQIAPETSYTTFKSAVEKHSIPNRGVVAGLNGGTMQADQKPIISGTGSWTMSYGNPANTSASEEEFSGKTSMSGFELRWIGAPGPELAWDRQTAESPPLATNGRFYCQGRGRILALDSHNGSVLWTKELDDAQRFNMLRDAGNLTADDDGVWLSLRKECWKMDGDTGKLSTFALIDGPRTDLEYSWNYICRTGNQLLGSASVDEAFYKEHWGSQFWYTDAGGTLANQVVSDNLFALDPSTGNLNWKYSNGLILGVTITVGNGKVFFLETRNSITVAGSTRRLSSAIWKQDLHLVCLDLATGAKLWEKPSSFTGGNYTVFLMYDSVSDKLILTSGDGSNNHLHAFNPTTGVGVWNKTSGNIKTHHGGKNQHAVISNGEILIYPHVYAAATGALLRSNTIPQTNGCNTYWGSKNMLFYRTGYSGNGLSMWPNDGSGTTTGVDHVKGACWLNWAPADGMFLIQEKSSGCSCGAWIQTSLGWGPK